MRRMLVVIGLALLTACGGSSEPASCALCGTWYSRYDAAGSPIAHTANRSLELRDDATFTEIFGTPPGLAGTWATTSTRIVLSYSGTGPETGTILADSITFPTHNTFPLRVYAR